MSAELQGEQKGTENPKIQTQEEAAGSQNSQKQEFC